MSEIGDDMMNNDNWIVVYASPDTNDLVMLSYYDLMNAIRMMDQIRKTYGYDLDLKLIKGEIWL